MPQKFADNARTLLQGSITAAATSLTVESAKADRFPVANTSDWGASANWFKAILVDSAGNREVIYVGTRSLGSAVFGNILRAQEGTTALSFAAGSSVVCSITSQDIQNVLAGLFPSLNISGGLDIGTYFHAVKRAYTDVVSPPFAAALVIDASQGNVFEVGDLTADITSMTISNSTPGQSIELSFKQGSTGANPGNYTVAVPAGAKVAGVPATGIGRVSKLYLRYSNRDSRWEGFWVPVPA
jgi:hypothetical protein